MIIVHLICTYSNNKKELENMPIWSGKFFEKKNKSIAPKNEIKEYLL